jgi:hypothetical protein
MTPAKEIGMQPIDNVGWYSAKTVYRHRLVQEGVTKTVFEERVVLFHAANFEDAIPKAETEAKRYCSAVENVVFLDFANVYYLPDESVGNGTEIYSLMRDSNLSDTEYLSRFHEDGHERWLD